MKINKKKISKKTKKSDKIINIFIVAVIIFTILVLNYSIKTMFFSAADNKGDTQNSITQEQTMNKMSLTNYDKALAKKFMDKNNDGKCDACGMPVEQCIDSGQMQCNMDPKTTIGILQSHHIHADWKIYINGEVVDFTGKDHMTGMRSGSSVSSFIHVDSGAPAPEKTGDVLHMHATGVPLWIFFDSIGMELPQGTKAYVNGKEILDWKNYVFKDLDKILIIDGQGDINQQLTTITNFARIH